MLRCLLELVVRRALTAAKAASTTFQASKTCPEHGYMFYCSFVFCTKIPAWPCVYGHISGATASFEGKQLNITELKLSYLTVVIGV